MTFTIHPDGMVGPVAVVGDFNDWAPTATFLASRDGMCRASVVMDTGRRHAFRYLGEGGRWFNDQAADDYQPNEFGGGDSVVDLTGGRHPLNLSVREGPEQVRRQGGARPLRGPIADSVGIDRVGSDLGG